MLRSYLSAVLRDGPLTRLAERERAPSAGDREIISSRGKNSHPVSVIVILSFGLGGLEVPCCIGRCCGFVFCLILPDFGPFWVENPVGTKSCTLELGVFWFRTKKRKNEICGCGAVFSKAL